MFLRISRIAALASLLLFVASIAAANSLPSFSEQTRTMWVELGLIGFFGCVALYFVAVGRNWGGPDDEAPSFQLTDPALRIGLSERRSLGAWLRAQGSELFIVAALMSILILGLIGSLVSETLGVVGTAIGGVLTVIAVVLFIWRMAVMYRTREEYWLAMGRHRWQFAAYLTATSAAALGAGVAHLLYHSKIVTGVGIIIAFFLLMRIRLLLQDLW